MNVEQSMCAASGPEAQWEQVNWSQCELKVRRLQARIAATIPIFITCS
jgi:RNA-directed DNA polymerase